MGAIFGAIAPMENAGNPGGEWQTYDLTLVDRHVTVVLNGVNVIDNQPIDAPTPGAIHTNADAPGPVYLQGDHTSVKYKNAAHQELIFDLGHSACIFVIPLATSPKLRGHCNSRPELRFSENSELIW